MRTIDTEDSRIASLLVADEPELPHERGTDVVVRLRDGRSFILTVQTLEALAHRLDDSSSFVATGVLVVRRMSDGAVLHAVRSALSQGLEYFGTLQPPIEE